jgi:hypothetical protein
LNEARIDWHQEDASTRFSERGVIAIDNVLIDHYGKTITDVGYFWDHAEERHKIAHDYLLPITSARQASTIRCTFRRFRKESQCQNDNQEFINHTGLTVELIDQVCQRKIPGTFTWDSYFTNARILNHVHGKQDAHGNPRAYVGDLKMNRKVLWKGVEQKISVRRPNDAMIPSGIPANRRWVCMVRTSRADMMSLIASTWTHTV